MVEKINTYWVLDWYLVKEEHKPNPDGTTNSIQVIKLSDLEEHDKQILEEFAKDYKMQIKQERDSVKNEIDYLIKSFSEDPSKSKLEVMPEEMTIKSKDLSKIQSRTVVYVLECLKKRLKL